MRTIKGLSKKNQSMALQRKCVCNQGECKVKCVDKKVLLTHKQGKPYTASSIKRASANKAVK